MNSLQRGQIIDVDLEPKRGSKTGKIWLGLMGQLSKYLALVNVK